ncbi:hypothetical protein B0H13DRAFT_2658596 [Mycena leptocephala]|nr:hypothetical protein B0H13DRAFT_2658596 [Mycena leptocephala]
MLSEDESDLTDLDQLSQEYEETRPAKKKGKGKGKAKAGEYRIRHALKAPRATTYSTEALYKQIHNGDIDLDPEYQREVVWPESKQIGIIDSIFRNFYVPPVIFAVNTLDDGTETRTCIDGKQRLTSIFRFLEGLIPHKDSLTGDKLWYRDNPDHRTRAAKKILPEKYRNMFDGRADADEREIFQRVQLGVALTPAEKLKVLNTPRAQFIRTLQDDFLNNEASGLGGAALAGTAPADPTSAASPRLSNASSSPQDDLHPGHRKWLADPAPLAPASPRVSRTPTTSSRRSAPAQGTLSLEALGKAVAAMRADVRRVHDDIRNNSKVYKTMNAFIDGYGFPQPSGAKAGTKRKAVRAAADEDEEDAMDVDGEDSDDDYAPARKAAPRKRASPQKKAPQRPHARRTTTHATHVHIISAHGGRARSGESARNAERDRPHPCSSGRAAADADDAALAEFDALLQHHGQQRTQHGAAGVAAVLEANLMGGGGGWGGGGTSSGPRVKTEPGALPLSAGSNGAPRIPLGEWERGYDGGGMAAGVRVVVGIVVVGTIGRDKQRYRERERPERRW